jgi:hypothetical protein
LKDLVNAVKDLRHSIRGDASTLWNLAVEGSAAKKKGSVAIDFIRHPVSTEFLEC